MCFVDDAICCVYVETKSEPALSLIIQWCSCFSSPRRCSATDDEINQRPKQCFAKKKMRHHVSGAMGFRKQHTKTFKANQIFKYQHDKNHTSCTRFHWMQNKAASIIKTHKRAGMKIYPLGYTKCLWWWKYAFNYLFHWLFSKMSDLVLVLNFFFFLTSKSKASWHWIILTVFSSPLHIYFYFFLYFCTIQQGFEHETLQMPNISEHILIIWAIL